ncbi:endonuclease/exonuclease/phosphatase family protein [Embleya scabrispora]|uniref:endonuclease/exonuclease/phosphatase family protein n=1 Tax=Embleya scabrispora TaxID=159449 RepID=UPI000382C257|nr:endonuclease/exonuclease/phosphatase family protein [Embleya scabrispora]MYS84978.1 endonuclease [Streptomyces sp. SID5474]
MTIGTWNLENLFRPGEPDGPEDDQSYRAKLAALAAAITEFEPDLLGVQEVGNPDALADLVDLLDGEWHIALSAHPDGRGIRVGFLGRTPLTTIADVTAFPARFAPVQTQDTGVPVGAMGRGGLAVTLEPVPGRTLTAAVCHLKSKLLGYPGNRHAPRDEGERARYAAYALWRRGAEAATMRALADRLLADDGRTHDVVVMGDLNDQPQAATTQILYGPPGSQIGTPGFDRPDRGDATRLWNLAPLIPEEQRFSRVFEGQVELIDHILVSHALLARVDTVTTGTGHTLSSVTDQPAERQGRPGSDHAPVVARLTY